MLMILLTTETGTWQSLYDSYLFECFLGRKKERDRRKKRKKKGGSENFRKFRQHRKPYYSSFF